MSHTRLHPAFTFTDEKLAELKRVAPEAFADGKVHWEVLKEALGEHVDDEGAEAEHFGLNWPGKRDARRMAGLPSTGALVPKPGDGVHEDSTRNIFIEGENLEVLKLLQKSYRGKVKMIYIDPPYNTGNDFVYEDDFTEPLEEYLRRTGQVDEEGSALTTNPRADGRFHSKWLSMMYPRLRVARQLLRDDGAIFVSIDDNEVHHLRALMNEVFGEENFVASVARVAKKTSNKGTHVAPSKDYVVTFARISAQLPPFMDEVDEDYASRFDGTDTRGQFAVVGLYQAALDSRPNQRYWVECPDGSFAIPPGSVFPERVADASHVVPESNTDKVWRWSFESYLQKKELLVFKQTKKSPLLTPDGSSSKWNVYTKYYLHERLEDGIRPRDFVDDITNDQGTIDLRNLGLAEYFDFPKPTALIKRLCTWLNDKEGLYVDFYAGSGTTGQAIQELNDSDGGNRKFVLVQWPEVLDESHPARKERFKTIADISQERLRRAFKRNKSSCGFKSFSLAHSNYRAWKDYHGTDAKALEDLFAAQETPLREGWSVEGLTTEVMLLEGFPLDSRVEVVDFNPGSKAGAGKNVVQRIHHEWHQHALFVCLDKKIHADTIAALVLGEGDTFICLDTAIDDQSKLRLSDKGMIKTI